MTPVGDPPRRPTIDDVAAAAGVSRGTVSRALNGGKWVSPDAQRAVDAAVRRTGYRANAHARGLRRRRAGAIAFVLGEDVERLFADPNVAVLLTHVSKALAEQGHAMVLLLAADDASKRHALDFLGTGQIDGVMLVSWSRDLTLLDELSAAGMPVVCCGTPDRRGGGAGWVAADDREGARRMTEHLLSLGRRSPAMIAGPDDRLGASLRVDGYRDALGEAAAGQVEYGDWSERSGAEAMTRLLESSPGVDAVFAANDRMAAGALTVLLAAGRRVPEDVAVGGFDDSPAASAATPAITTMRQPFERIAREMTRLLLAEIDGEQPAHVQLATEFVRRESA
ncbi:LacI family DNA-binding transcriptional regulator [Rathayibacter sp. SD072]|uniref:LacI family DNA-binding transcriptional regulator n=1 Tax=Rathayibacter sp. SD072 TaxID=2781731 RepID=UPI001A97BFCF|nr:LacI family DNA-binding transcriptional regulator [Rathayibacter sp. SD072]MBO0985463.1 LacI family DNA-binding transcriptional regulator [Rathayibacter sp. SD072]